MNARAVNQQMSRLLPFLVPIMIVTGIVFPGVAGHLVPLVTPVFFVMVFSGSFTLRFSDIAKVAHHPVPVIVVLLVVHIVMPFVVWGVAHPAFSHYPDIEAGMILQFLIPTASTGFAWIAITGGNLPLALVTVFLDTLLAPLLIPLGIKVLIGASISVDMWALMQSVAVMILIPSVLAVCCNEATKGRVSGRIGPWLQVVVKCGVCVVILASGTKIAPLVRTFDPFLVVVALTMFALSLVGYAAGIGAAKVLKADRETSIFLLYGSALRNINAGAVIAVAYFPPAAVFPVVISMLFQQATAGAVAGIIERRMPR
ncbi:hypothetical protein I6E29_05925 [Arcanobacterium haemolyticum]|nr:hypothetical protein [Arcanobacterium haemolyticum]